MVGGLLGFAALFALSLCGWSSGDGLRGVRTDLGLLLTAAGAGACSASVLAWGLTKRALSVAAAAVVGLLPAAVRVAAYFTDRF